MVRAKQVFQKLHIGVWVFLLLQILILSLFADGDQEFFTQLLFLYAISTCISLTPIGEFFICFFAHAMYSPRSDMKDSMEWLLDDVLNDVKTKTPGYNGSIKLKIINIDQPYICALGRKTIAFSPSFLDLPDDEQRGLLASEVAHLALRHNFWMMLAGCSNPFFLFMWLFLQFMKLMFMIVGIFYCIITQSNLHRVVTAITMALTNALIKLWTAFCMIFIYFENRQNVFVADRYAADIGYGYELARALDDLKYLHIRTGLIGSLFQSKPHPDARINSLIEYGVPYRGY